MHTVSYCSMKGDGNYNEDRIGFSNDLVWIIDGATEAYSSNYFSSTNDVVWLVNSLSEELCKYSKNDFSLYTIISMAINDLKEKIVSIKPDYFAIPEYQMPSFAICLLRVNKNNVQYYILGDCGTILQLNNKNKVIVDSRINKISNSTINEMLRIKNESNQTKNSNLELVKNKMRENRKLINKEDGYWIGNILGTGLSHAIIGSIQVDPNSYILCFSDGYSRIWELYKKLNPDMILLDPINIMNYVSQIRDIENSDFNCIEYPRIKKSDDLSYILLKST